MKQVGQRILQRAVEREQAPGDLLAPDAQIVGGDNSKYSRRSSSNGKHAVALPWESENASSTIDSDREINLNSWNRRDFPAPVRPSPPPVAHARSEPVPRRA